MVSWFEESESESESGIPSRYHESYRHRRASETPNITPSVANSSPVSTCYLRRSKSNGHGDFRVIWIVPFVIWGVRPLETTDFSNIFPFMGTDKHIFLVKEHLNHNYRIWP